MATELEDLKILRSAEQVADAIWNRVSTWNEFPRDVIGRQMARAADSIDANIAESFGRFNFGEKIQFLYYSRGSLFETKYWLNRAKSRALMSEGELQISIAELTNLARQLNSFANSLKSQKAKSGTHKVVHESQAEYPTFESNDNDPSLNLFTDTDFDWLAS